MKVLRKKNKKSRKKIFGGLLVAIILLSGLFWHKDIQEFSAGGMFAAGNYYFSEKSYHLNRAENFFQYALKIKENYPGAHYQLARIYFLRGNFNLARKEINAELAAYPDFKRSFYVRGLINGYAGRFPEAVNDFENFLHWKPSSWAAHNDLAWVYFQVGNFEKVLELANDGLRYAPENPWLLNTKGLALYNLDRPAEAKEYLTQALEKTEKLAPEDWKKAYPGNDPNFSANGLTQMLAAIKTNLAI
jgi:tetratricopeptide (TPR) repeat protein